MYKVSKLLTVHDVASKPEDIFLPRSVDSWSRQVGQVLLLVRQVLVVFHADSGHGLAGLSQDPLDPFSMLDRACLEQYALMVELGGMIHLDPFGELDRDDDVQGSFRSGVGNPKRSTRACVWKTDCTEIRGVPNLTLKLIVWVKPNCLATGDVTP